MPHAFPTRRSSDLNETMGVFEAGRLFVLIDRRDYWQCAFVFPKGRAEEIRDEGIDAFRKRVAAVGPETAAGADAISGWDAVKLLTVSVDRLETWHQTGLLFIGDAAHAIDRKSVVEGKSGSGRVDLGGWRSCKKKNLDKTSKR